MASTSDDPTRNDPEIHGPAGDVEPAGGGGPESNTPAARGNGALEGDWRASIGDPRAQAAAGKFATPGALAKSYSELEKKLGGAVNPPREGAGAAEWDSFYARLGRPDSPDGYELGQPDLPEGAAFNEELPAMAGELFHRHGLSKAQAEGLYRDYVALEVERIGRDGAAFADQSAAAEAQLRRRWGKEYDANAALANHAFKRYFGENAASARDLKLADGTLLGNHPMVAEAFAAIGRETAEDSFHSGAAHEQSRDTLIKRLADIRRKPEYAISDADRAEKRQIYVALYGTEPADGRPG